MLCPGYKSTYGGACIPYTGAARAIDDHPSDWDTPLRIRYQTIEFGELDIHLCSLRDRQQIRDDDGRAEAMGVPRAHWSLFGVVWASSRVLANFMLDFDMAGKRILEVGCGTALSSLLLNKLHQNITATDHHPDAEAMLQRNVALNGDATIPYQRTGWEDDDNTLGLFDLIIGSDLLYESDNVNILASFIDTHAMPNSEVVIVDPGRGQAARFSKQMAGYGFDCEQSLVSGDAGAGAGEDYRGRILQYQRA